MCIHKFLGSNLASDIHHSTLHTHFLKVNSAKISLEKNKKGGGGFKNLDILRLFQVN